MPHPFPSLSPPKPPAVDACARNQLTNNPHVIHNSCCSPLMAVSRKSRHIHVLGCSPSPQPCPSSSFTCRKQPSGLGLGGGGGSTWSRCTGDICSLRMRTVSKPSDDRVASHWSPHSTGPSSQSKDSIRCYLFIYLLLAYFFVVDK